MKTVGCFALLGLIVALDFLLAWVFQLLWNWLMPVIFHLPVLTYWQAFGLTVFLSLISGFFTPRSK